MYRWSARRLKALREKRGLTQEQLAEKAGLSRGYLARLETRRQEPKATVIGQLATALRCGVAELFEGST